MPFFELILAYIDNQTNMLYKKIIGTLSLLIILSGATLATASYVAACSGQGTQSYEGILLSKSDGWYTIQTAQATTLRIKVDKATRYTSHLSYESLSAGDYLKINAVLKGADQTAKLIKRTSHNGDGYGQGGNNINLVNAVVTSLSIAHKTITVDGGDGILITFTIDSSTHFVKTSFTEIAVGDTLHINGEGSATGFIAKNIIK